MYGIYYGYSLKAVHNNNLHYLENQTKQANSHNCQGTQAPKLIVGSGNVKAIPDRPSRIEIRDEGIKYIEEKITNQLDNIDNIID